jgi:two-component system, probable response regulator PhcQ
MTRRAVVLFVDDEPDICDALCRSLRKSDYTLLVARAPDEAFALLQREAVDVIVSDHLMPEMTGLEFLKLARDRCPDAVRIMLTGHADMETVIAAMNQGEIYRFLTKPWEDLELQVTLHLALEKRDLERENRRLLAALGASEELLARLQRENPALSSLIRRDPRAQGAAS